MNEIITIIGLGYVGLTTAAAYIRAGFDVAGIETGHDQVRRIGSGDMGDLSNDDCETIGAAMLAGRFSINPVVLDTVGCYLVCVPPGDAEPFSLNGSLDFVTENLRAGQTVVLQSTLHPGTTRYWAAHLQHETGLEIGGDFFIAHSPERINPGDRQHTIENTPKLVGGITPACTRQAMLYISQVCNDVVPVSSPEVAEFAKLLENAFRLVNVALVNEIAELIRLGGTSPHEVVQAAATKPFGYMPFWPGIGAGGPCIPVVPKYLSRFASRNGINSPIINDALAANEDLPRRIAGRIAATGAKKALVVGITFKPNVRSTKGSHAVEVLEWLGKMGLEADFYDPNVAELGGRLGVDIDAKSDMWYNIIVVLVNHSSLPWAKIRRLAPQILDFCGATGA